MQNLQTTPARPLMPYQGKPLLHFDSLLLRRALLLCFFVGLFFLIPAAMADDALTLPVGDMKSRRRQLVENADFRPALGTRHFYLGRLWYWLGQIHHHPVPLGQ